MADVAVFFGKIFTPNLMIKKCFFQTNWFFLKRYVWMFEKSEKIHSYSRKYYANFRYIIKVRIQKLYEIWIFLWSDAHGITIRPSNREFVMNDLWHYLFQKTDYATRREVGHRVIVSCFGQQNMIYKFVINI